MATLFDARTEDVHVPKPLLSRNSVAGHELQKIWRNDNVAVFCRSIPAKIPHEYEVIIIRLLPEGSLPDGTKVPARFAYPKSSDWGKYGWSIPDSFRSALLEHFQAGGSFQRTQLKSWCRWFRGS